MVGSARLVRRMRCEVMSERRVMTLPGCWAHLKRWCPLAALAVRYPPLTLPSRPVHQPDIAARPLLEPPVTCQHPCITLDVVSQSPGYKQFQAQAISVTAWENAIIAAVLPYISPVPLTAKMAYQPFWPYIMDDLPPFNNEDTFYQLHDDHVNALMMMPPCMQYDLVLSMEIPSVQQQPSYIPDMLMSGEIGWDDFPPPLPLEYSPPQMQMQVPIVADVTDARQRALHGSISSNSGTPGSYESSIIQDTRSSSMESSGNNSSQSPESSSPNVKVGSKRKAETEVGQEVARKRHRKKFSDEAKKETHRTRLEGACLRCQKNRKRVRLMR